MLEIGKEFIMNGYNYCILDIFTFENYDFVLFSKEKDKVGYEFYYYNFDGKNYNFKIVEDKDLNFKLLKFIESKGD